MNYKSMIYDIDDMFVLSDRYDDISLPDEKSSIQIPRVYLGVTGVFAELQAADDMGHVISVLARELRLPDNRVTAFAPSNDGVCYMDWERGEQVDLAYDDFIKKMQLLSRGYTADDAKPEADAVNHTITTQALATAIARMEMLKIEEPEENNGKYRLTDDGWQVRRTISTWMDGTREAYFPCMEEDPDELFILTLVGGLVGAHKYKTGQIGQGLLYTLTFGMCGIAYVMDLITMLTGNYRIQKNEYLPNRCGRALIIRRKHVWYLREVSDRQKKLLLMPVAILIATLAVIFVYRPLLGLIGGGLSGLAGGVSQSIFKNRTSSLMRGGF